MRKITKFVAIVAALVMTLSLTACGGGASSSAAAESSAPSSQSAASSQEDASQSEASQSEASSQEDASQDETLGSEVSSPVSVSFQFPAGYEEMSSGQEGVRVAMNGSTVAMMATAPLQGADGAESLKTTETELLSAMKQEMGTEPVAQEALSLPFASNFSASLFQKEADGVKTNTYVALFTTEKNLVLYQIIGAEEGWDAVLAELLDCLSSYQEG